ncbi:MAG: hypothetical protein ACK5KQ_04395 [Anaerorhabdus sp.]
MIIVNMPLKRDVVKGVAEKFDEEGHKFTFIKEEGIKLFYEDVNTNEEEGATLLKKAIKKELGPAFFFNVEVK